MTVSPPKLPALVDPIYAAIADDLRDTGYAILSNALPESLGAALLKHLQAMPDYKFERAGIGREEDLVLNDRVRTDAVCWINGDSEAGKAWLAWSEALRIYLNQSLLLGLFSFESHFAHYAPGDFYKTHVDAFRGETNRIVSMVVYLNPEWLPEYGGELVLYTEGKTPGESRRVMPALGTIVLFLSEETPHEVLPATEHRYSIAGWFRVNGSTGGRVDPPR